MSKVFNTIGCLNTIINHLNQHGIHDLETLEDIIDFQNGYLSIRMQVIIKHENLIEKERKELQLDITQLEELIAKRRSQVENDINNHIHLLYEKLDLLYIGQSNHVLQRIVNILKQWNYRIQIRYKKANVNSCVENSIKSLNEILKQKSLRYQFIHSNFDDAVRDNYKKQVAEIDRKKRLIDEVSSFIAGAIGEMNVVAILKKLPDNYYLINDFSISFSKAIYNRHENDYIKSIQIDHILISPAGIFLIETKNWSAASMQNLNLRSPVKQIKRTSFALFKLISIDISCNNLQLDRHLWGDKKIPLRNLIVLTNSKPKEEFQFVKILTVAELMGYIKYFKPVFSALETERIKDYLLMLNSKQIIHNN